MGMESNAGSDGLGDRERTRHAAGKKRGWTEDLSVSTTQIKHTNMENNHISTVLAHFPQTKIPYR